MYVVCALASCWSRGSRPASVLLRLLRYWRMLRPTPARKSLALAMLVFIRAVEAFEVPALVGLLTVAPERELGAYGEAFDRVVRSVQLNER